MRPLLDLRLNAILDPERAGGHDLLDLARAVAAGGATLVQLRDKKSDTRAMVDVIRNLEQIDGADRQAMAAYVYSLPAREGPKPPLKSPRKP